MKALIWLKNLKTRTKLLAGFGLMVAVALYLSSVGLYTLYNYSSTADNVLHLNRANGYFVEARVNASNLAAGRNIENYNAAVALIDSAIAEVDRVIIKI